MKFWFSLIVIVVTSSGCGGQGGKEHVAVTRQALGSSANPPGGLAVAQVPQFVAVTFDDNFSTEGMDWATGFFRPLHNPAGSGNAGTFDGTPARTTFPNNSVYLGGMQASWQTAVNDGHEIANHTVNHGDGIAYSVAQWNQEITSCTSALAGGLEPGPRHQP
jgi:peptidoglycan/xylan/chitin deacetylase (PgdA/CDA1 family)